MMKKNPPYLAWTRVSTYLDRDDKEEKETNVENSPTDETPPSMI